MPSFVERGVRIPIEDLKSGDSVRLGHKDITVVDVCEFSEHFALRDRAGNTYRIPKGRKIRRQS